MKLKPLQDLSQRERLMLLAAALVIFLTVLTFGIVQPYRAALSRLDTQIASRRRQLSELQQLSREYRNLQQQTAAGEQRLAAAGDFSLLTFVEATSIRLAGRDRLISMRPQPGAMLEEFREEAVEVRLERIRLDQLVQLLIAADRAPAPMQVKSLRLRTRFDDRALLDVTLVFASYRRIS